MVDASLLIEAQVCVGPGPLSSLNKRQNCAPGASETTLVHVLRLL